jgi:phosphohistidine phosphatase
MKKLLIVRHAKSDQSLGVQDYERPLNNRGKSNSPEMGIELKRRNLTPDMIVASPAKRSRQTVEFMLDNLGYKKDVIWNENLYFGDTTDYLEIIRSMPDEAETLMVAGHNPNIEKLTSLLSRNPEADILMKTCAVSHFTCPVERWQDLEPGANHLEWIIDPKMI